MADIQSAAAEIRRGKKTERKKNKPQDENIMVCPISSGDHKKSSHRPNSTFLSPSINTCGVINDVVTAKIIAIFRSGC